MYPTRGGRGATISAAQAQVGLGRSGLGPTPTCTTTLTHALERWRRGRKSDSDAPCRYVGTRVCSRACVSGVRRRRRKSDSDASGLLGGEGGFGDAQGVQVRRRGERTAGRRREIPLLARGRRWRGTPCWREILGRRSRRPRGGPLVDDASQSSRRRSTRDPPIDRSTAADTRRGTGEFLRRR